MSAALSPALTPDWGPWLPWLGLAAVAGVVGAVARRVPLTTAHAAAIAEAIRRSAQGRAEWQSATPGHVRRLRATLLLAAWVLLALPMPFLADAGSRVGSALTLWRHRAHVVPVAVTATWYEPMHRGPYGSRHLALRWQRDGRPGEAHLVRVAPSAATPDADAPPSSLWVDRQHPALWSEDAPSEGARTGAGVLAAFVAVLAGATAWVLARALRRINRAPLCTLPPPTSAADAAIGDAARVIGRAMTLLIGGGVAVWIVCTIGGSWWRDARADRRFAREAVAVPVLIDTAAYAGLEATREADIMRAVDDASVDMADAVLPPGDPRPPLRDRMGPGFNASMLNDGSRVATTALVLPDGSAVPRLGRGAMAWRAAEDWPLLLVAVIAFGVLIPLLALGGPAASALHGVLVRRVSAFREPHDGGAMLRVVLSERVGRADP